MKYMGHKGRIVEEIRLQISQFAYDANALCDAFCGSAIVAWDLAEHFEKPVLASDLQSFAVARAAAVITRTTPIRDLSFVETWYIRASSIVEKLAIGHRLPPTPSLSGKQSIDASRSSVIRTRNYVRGTLRKILTRTGHSWPITNAYAGYYFSLEQALALDALRMTLPSQQAEQVVALSALIGAASKCSASPGHTAQPLGISRKALPHTLNAWTRSVFDVVKKEIAHMAPRHAKVEGEVRTLGWEETIDLLSPGDVVFCDPPYSAVQYSRFYHVLETISRGTESQVFGVGRNPPFSERPVSKFSRHGQAKEEAENLLRAASDRDLRLVITFPISRQSNGLRAFTFMQKAKKYFRKVDVAEVQSMFSSLGGTGKNGARPARESRIERIICCSS